MSCAVCDLDPCICQPAETPPIRSTYTPQDWGITREQFGEALYEAIVTVGRILQLKHQRQHVAPARIKKGELKVWQKQESVLLGQLRKQMAKLSDADTAEMMRRYQFVQSI